MYSLDKDWRHKNINMYDPRHFKIESYYSEAHKKEIKHSFGDELLNNLHLLPDPLKKNLADSIITNEGTYTTKTKNSNKNSLNMHSVESEPPKMENNSNLNIAMHMPSFSGITNFFSNVISVFTSAVSQMRPKSPQYYDCYDDSIQQGSPPFWQYSSSEVQNKSAQSKTKSDMNLDCKSAAAQCEEKLNKVKILLSTPPIEAPKNRQRRPKKVFVDPKSVEDSVEDAFLPDDIVSMSNNTYIEFYSPYQTHTDELYETASPEIKMESAPDDTGIREPVLEISENNSESANKETQSVEDSKTSRLELVSTCEDKLSQLKALLQEKRTKKTLPEFPQQTVKQNKAENGTKLKTKDKRYKNHNRTTDKRKHTNMRKTIQDDLIFAQEINTEDLSSNENSPTTISDNLNHTNSSESLNETPKEYFNEISGRFRSNSTTESEDSFQIVFNDSPKGSSRMRRASDCDSVDSFIVFEESPDSCYTSNDVFGNSDESCSDFTDSESDLSDTEDTVEGSLPPNLSATVTDLTDNSLYDTSTDEVDCSVQTIGDVVESVSVLEQEPEAATKSTGVLLNDAKKLLRRQSQAEPKKVQFSTIPPKVHVMRVWAFAARQARAGHWERCALDRVRFKRRIADVDMAVSWVLKPQHRSRVMFQRFMPWWNALKRKEIAEKKAKDEAEKLRKEEEEELQKAEELLKEEELKIAAKLLEENSGNGNVISTDNKESNDKSNAIAIVSKDIDIVNALDKMDIGNKTGDKKNTLKTVKSNKKFNSVLKDNSVGNLKNKNYNVPMKGIRILKLAHVTDT